MSAWSPSRALERFTLTRQVWSLGREEGAVLAPQLRLRPDGRIACYRAPDTHRWDVRAGRLVLLDRIGRATTIFDAPREEDGRTVFEGEFLPEPGTRYRLCETERLDHAPSPAERIDPRAGDRPVARRNLVVIHAGADAAFRRWARDLSSEDRSWDLCLSWRDHPDGYPDEPDAAWHVVQHGIGKWFALHRLLHAGSPLRHYDYVMCPDDDLDWTWAGINAAFAAARDHDLQLAQPAGDRATPDAWSLRPVPAIGAHCPIFAAEALRTCAPSFGIDAPADLFGPLWSAVLGWPEGRVAEIDLGNPPGRHTAEPGGDDAAATHAMLARWGLRV